MNAADICTGSRPCPCKIRSFFRQSSATFGQWVSWHLATLGAAHTHFPTDARKQMNPTYSTLVCSHWHTLGCRAVSNTSLPSPSGPRAQVHCPTRLQSSDPWMWQNIFLTPHGLDPHKIALVSRGMHSFDSLLWGVMQALCTQTLW